MESIGAQHAKEEDLIRKNNMVNVEKKFQYPTN